VGARARPRGARRLGGARAAYREAKERDELRFRAPDAINAIIREEAGRHGAKLVESQRAVAAASPGGVPGATLLLEHLHPNVDGYLRIAEAFADALRAQRMPAPPPAPLAAVRAAVPITPVDSLAAVYRTDRLTAGWPFAPRGTARPGHRGHAGAAHRRRAPPPRRSCAASCPWAVATDRFRVAAAEAGDTAQAVRAARALAFEFPYTPRPRLDAAQLLASARRDREAAGRGAARRRERGDPRRAAPVALAGAPPGRLGDGHGGARVGRRARAGDAGVRGCSPRVRHAPPACPRSAPGGSPARHGLACTSSPRPTRFTEQYDSARANARRLRAVPPAHGDGAALLAALARA
jgi:hypothetical protein